MQQSREFQKTGINFVLALLRVMMYYTLKTVFVLLDNVAGNLMQYLDQLNIVPIHNLPHHVHSMGLLKKKNYMKKIFGKNKEAELTLRFIKIEKVLTFDI